MLHLNDWDIVIASLGVLVFLCGVVSLGMFYADRYRRLMHH